MSECNSISSRLGNVERSIRHKPLRALGIGALAGFVIGGGYRTRLGVSLLWLMGRTAVKESIISAVSGAIDKTDRSGKDRKRCRPGAARPASDTGAGESKGWASRNSVHSA